MTTEKEVDEFFDSITDTHDFGDGDGRVPYVIIRGEKIRKGGIEHSGKIIHECLIRIKQIL